MNAGNSTDPYVTVICPTCHARLNPRRELIGKRVRCPDCGVAVRVEEGPAATAPAPAPKVGEYALSEPDHPVERPKTFLLSCPTCGTRMFPSVELVGKRVKCPDCHTPVRVPPPPIEREVKARRPIGEYNVGVAITPIAPPEPVYTKHREKIEKEQAPPPPPPQLWWLTGVFDFPWREETISRWFVLTIFTTLTAAFSFMTIGAIAALGNAGAMMQFGTMALIVLSGLAWFLSLAYMSGCVVSIVRSTAAGNDKVADWSALEIQESLWGSVILWLPLLSAAAFAYAAMVLIRLAAPGWEWWASLAIFYLVYPVMFASVMEQGSALGLFSGEALRLIWGYGRGWLLLMAELGLLVGAAFAATRFALQYTTILTALVGGPIYAALIMILSRLVGRFFYRAHEVTEARRLKKEQEAADQAEDDEEESEVEAVLDDDLDFGV